MILSPIIVVVLLVLVVVVEKAAGRITSTVFEINHHLFKLVVG